MASGCVVQMNASYGYYWNFNVIFVLFNLFYYYLIYYYSFCLFIFINFENFHIGYIRFYPKINLMVTAYDEMSSKVISIHIIQTYSLSVESSLFLTAPLATRWITVRVQCLTHSLIKLVYKQWHYMFVSWWTLSFMDILFLKVVVPHRWGRFPQFWYRECHIHGCLWGYTGGFNGR